MNERKRHVGAWFVGTLLAIVVYILSSGPSCWLLEHTSFGLFEPACQTFNTIYAPLAWVYKHSPTAERAIEWYYDLWELSPLEVSTM